MATYNELTTEEKAIVDKYLDVDDLNMVLSDTQVMIDFGVTIQQLADHFGTEVCDLDYNESYIDINTEKYTHTVYCNNGELTIGDIVEVWDEDTHMFDYSTKENEFYCF